MGCYIWYNKEGPGRVADPLSPLLAVPNVTAHPSTSVFDCTLNRPTCVFVIVSHSVNKHAIKYKLKNELCTINLIIKDRRLRWLEHVLRMDDNRLPRQAVHWDISGRESVSDHEKIG